MTEPGAVRQLAWMRLDRRRAKPLYRQIYERVREAVRNGSLPPGARLPSSRSLASQLSIARGTVELAYELLAGEGYVVGRAAGGTMVDPELALPRPAATARRRGLEPRDGSEGAPWERLGPLPPLPFQLGLPALDVFPRKLWSRLVARRARGLSTMAMIYQDAAGYAPLRQAVVRYLAIARGIGCSIDQVFVTAGFQGALGLITRVLLRAGDPVWVEDPGYFRARDALALAGARLVPVPVDGEGLVVEAGIERDGSARLAVVTPSHQAPLGVTLILARRLALLSWAAQVGAFVVEDDYDSEFRYRGRPLPALKSLDEAGRVLYVGSFSKVLAPGLRLGYLVVPSAEAARFAEAASLFAPSPSLLDQMAVADFMMEGHFGRHIKQMRRLYGDRRKALAEALAAALGDRLRIEVPAGGMHLIGWLEPGAKDVALAARARALGLAPSPLSAAAIEATSGPALLLSFTNIALEAAEREAQHLKRALDARG